VNSAIILGSLLVGSSNMGHFGGCGSNIPVFDTGTDENLAQNSAKDTHFLNVLLGSS
jgi:hypothetical protein